MLDPNKTDTDHIVKPVSNLVKGKSMPSLRYIGEACGDRGRHQRPAPLQLQPVPHPIITVTEHTPTPSPDYLSRHPEHGSIDSQLDALSLQGSRSGGVPERKPSLTRSQTDSNITYTKDEVLEAPGSVCYITRDGDIDYQVVVKAVHSVAVRDSTCTLRVCEVILNLVELLMELGVLKVPPSIHELPQPSTSKGEKSTPGPSTPGPSSSGQQHQSTSRGLEDVEYAGMEDPKSEIEVSSAHGKLINCVVRVVKQLGCPQGCGDGARGPPADFLRSQSQTLLSKLHRAGQKPFSRYFRAYVRRKPIMEVLDFFHAFLGFCVDPGSLLSPLNQKRSASKSPDIGTGPSGGYATNFGAGLGGGGSRGIEGHIVACVFKNLISRLIRLRDLKNQENINLYCDVRQLVTYVREAHGGTFRRVMLSALLDSASRPHKKEPSTQTTRVISSNLLV
ncbi:hypothetical protein B566_EDAN005288 [Ephemera danica]|nr:hypothetical protein B566_EDAN005288 [Ephemera danica]